LNRYTSAFVDDSKSAGQKTPQKDDVLQIIINFNVGLSNESTHKIQNVIQYYSLLCVFKISCLGIALTINDMFKTFIM